MKATAAERFFWAHAGWSHDPAKETEDEGRIRCAKNLAAAEGIAREAGYTFEWEVSDSTSHDFNPGPEVWALYDCLMRDATGRVVQSVCACDFGPEADGPYGDYRRVVEAELASQQIDIVLDDIA